MFERTEQTDRHTAVLTRRLIHLRERVRRGQGTGFELAHDKAEAAALDWALTLLREQGQPTCKPAEGGRG